MFVHFFVGGSLWNYRADLENNDSKMMVTISDPTETTFYVGATTPKGVQEQKKKKS